jgi:hypothetical protein
MALVSMEIARKTLGGSELTVYATDEALFTAATKVTIHNGRTTKFWSSSWLSGGNPAMMFPGLFQHSKRKNIIVANAMCNDVMHEITPTLLVEYVMLWILIDVVPFDPGDSSEGEIIWTGTVVGEYSARSAYEIQFDGSLVSSFPTIWRIWAPSRCKFFSWLMLQNRICFADRLLLGEWLNDYFCPLCRRNLKTVIHLF